MTTWALRISELRDRCDLTLAEIGAEIGLSTSAVCDIEQGRTKTPSGDAAVKLVDLHKKRLPDSTSRSLG